MERWLLLPFPMPPDRQPRPGPVVAAFDFDGTITTADSLCAFLRHARGDSRFAVGVARACPWLFAFLGGACSRDASKARFLAATLGGLSREQLEHAAQRFVAQGLPAMIRPEMAARLQEHRRLGHRLVLVSASPSFYLKVWAAQHGFEAVLATELEFTETGFSGRLASPNCWGPEKARRLQQWFGGETPGMLYAYGDTRGDREMLAMADRPWLRGDGDLPPMPGAQLPR